MTISQAASVNLWREATLDRLAALCMDAPQDEPPESILRRIIEAEVAIALDPRVSDAAPAAPVPLTDSELAKIAVEDEFLLYCDQDSFNEIARAIELAHGITGASK